MAVYAAGPRRPIVPPDPPPDSHDPLPPDGPEQLGEILARHVLPWLLAGGDGTAGGVMRPATPGGKAVDR